MNSYTDDLTSRLRIYSHKTAHRTPAKPLRFTAVLKTELATVSIETNITWYLLLSGCYMSNISYFRLPCSRDMPVLAPQLAEPRKNANEHQ